MKAIIATFLIIVALPATAYAGAGAGFGFGPTPPQTTVTESGEFGLSSTVKPTTKPTPVAEADGGYVWVKCKYETWKIPYPHIARTKIECYAPGLWIRVKRSALPKWYEA